jgi:6-phosphofructokinase 1
VLWRKGTFAGREDSFTTHLNSGRQLRRGFKQGKRLGLMTCNECANSVYITGFMCALFEEESGELLEVRQAVLGYLQQGGNPTSFDRI